MLDLQDHPDIDDQIAAHEQGIHPVEIASLVDELHVVDPCLASSYPEHGHEGQVEFSKGAWQKLFVQCHP